MSSSLISDAMRVRAFIASPQEDAIRKPFNALYEVLGKTQAETKSLGRSRGRIVVKEEMSNTRYFLTSPLHWQCLQHCQAGPFIALLPAED